MNIEEKKKARFWFELHKESDFVWSIVTLVIIVGLFIWTLCSLRLEISWWLILAPIGVILFVGFWFRRSKVSKMFWEYKPIIMVLPEVVIPEAESIISDSELPINIKILLDKEIKNAQKLDDATKLAEIVKKTKRYLCLKRELARNPDKILDLQWQVAKLEKKYSELHEEFRVLKKEFEA